MGAKVMNKKDICKKKLRFFIFYQYSGIIIQKKKRLPVGNLSLWALRDSNPRPSACKADALNQLS